MPIERADARAGGPSVRALFLSLLIAGGATAQPATPSAPEAAASAPPTTLQKVEVTA